MVQRRLLHIIPSLEQGGAERMLASFVANDSDNEHIVVKMFAGDGLFEEDVRASGARLVELGISRSPFVVLTLPLALVRFLALLITNRPTVVIAWLYYGALLSVVAKLLRVPVIWSIHAASFDLKTSYRPLTRLAIRACLRLSRAVPDYIQYCSRESMNHHVGLGFAARNSGVIENAVPLDEAETTDVKAALAGRPRIACIARFEAQKDHDNLLAATAVLADRDRQFEVLLAGSGCVEDNQELAALIRRHGVEQHVRCLGTLSDVPALIASCHCIVLSSSDGEAMPMVLLEAIAQGRPAVATDVGSSAQVIDRFGLVIPPKSPTALADALEQVVWTDRSFSNAASRDGRRYVIDNFSIGNFIKRWHAVFAERGF
ncbi:MAG: glycosyltransferase [Pseudomonadota bacterium]